MIELTCFFCAGFFEYPFRPGAKPRYCSDECRKQVARGRRLKRAHERAHERHLRILEGVAVNG
ncbi:hypothetical protein [Streptomyces coffeae]|uniref:DUF2116 family Zn-ribbon domain-containing protein n=1 Tax=Streptomyces coffeae TaxID=621382 RepID=A0ABS1NH45_9ACTN|nr:hypothetical protein [Streptomyces coffeae]MBL1099131.1 hypothetical protein [Streptomyces coffeae]